MYIYVVRAGDTLERISRISGVSEEAIAYVNQIFYPYNLAVGQALLLTAEPTGGAAAEFSSGPERGANGRIGTWRPALLSGYAYPFINPWILEQTLPYLTSLNVFSYGFTADGMLVPPEADDTRMIRAARAQRTRPVLTLVPLDEQGQFNNLLINSMINSAAYRERLISELLYTVREKGFEGIDVDFEYILASDRDAFTDFVAQLTGRMNAEGYTVSVALAPKTSDDQQGLLYEGKDYAGLGAAANSVLLMTYEWGYRDSPPMAVAPINEVRRVVEYAVTRIPPEKIDLGIPNYGYDWPLSSASGREPAQSIGNVEAVHRAVEFDAEIFFDETSKTPFYNYENNGVRHEVWFEDVRSIQAKFDLIKEYGLRGAGYWQIMRLFRANWALASSTFRIEKFL